MQSANYPFGEFEPTFGSQMSPHQPVFTATNIRRKGCFACGWRKKKCTPVDGIAPSPSNPCTECTKLNIRCDGRGLKRPPGKDRANAVRAVLKLWIADKKNRKHYHPFNLAPYYEPLTPETSVVDPNPAPTAHVVQGAFPDEPIIDPTVDYDLTRAVFPSSYASQGGADNGQTESSLPYPYALYNCPLGEHRGCNSDRSPAWGNIDCLSSHVGFETVCNCNCHKPPGLWEGEYTALNDHYPPGFAGHSVPYFDSNAAHNWTER